MNNFIWDLVKYLVPMILIAIRKALSPENFVKFADAIFDWVERKIESLDPENDDDYDEWLLELVKIIRAAINVPDLPDGE